MRRDLEALQQRLEDCGRRKEEPQPGRGIRKSGRSPDLLRRRTGGSRYQPVVKGDGLLQSVMERVR